MPLCPRPFLLLAMALITAVPARAENYDRAGIELPGPDATAIPDQKIGSIRHGGWLFPTSVIEPPHRGAVRIFSLEPALGSPRPIGMAQVL